MLKHQWSVLSNAINVLHTVHCFSHKTKRLYETNIFEIKSNAFAKVLSKYLHMHRNGTHIKTFVYAFKCFHAKRHHRLYLNQVKDLYANALAYILVVTYLSYTCTPCARFMRQPIVSLPPRCLSLTEPRQVCLHFQVNYVDEVHA